MVSYVYMGWSTACGIIFAAFALVAIKVYCTMRATIAEANRKILEDEAEEEYEKKPEDEKKDEHKPAPITNNKDVDVELGSAVGGFMTDLEPSTQGSSSGSFGSRPMSLTPGAVAAINGYLNAPDYDSPPGSYPGMSPRAIPEDMSSGSDFAKFGMAPVDSDGKFLIEGSYLLDDNLDALRSPSETSDPYSTLPHLPARRSSSSPNMMANTQTEEDDISLFFNSNSNPSLHSASTNSWHNLVTNGDINKSPPC
eukprot:TRINITY_DN21391_c0_g1_i1.p1 TRINITY_DN21391_c0_g1~~TRINITY_DN21391_c0_g1_i1.p1  ORF type:complete len:279 (+),score=61.85 TRINITY_DN21391_c0_g1_i1:80-838(+)